MQNRIWRADLRGIQRQRHLQAFRKVGNRGLYRRQGRERARQPLDDLLLRLHVLQPRRLMQDGHEAGELMPRGNRPRLGRPRLGW